MNRVDKLAHKEIEDLLMRDEEFRYQLLGRMKNDCITSIQNGRLTHLWGITVDNHIRYMEALWRSFPNDKTPEWCRLKHIKEYKKLLKIIENKNKV